MTVLQPVNMYRGQPGSTSTTLYTAPSTAGSYAIVKEVVICNTDVEDLTIDLHTVENAGSVADDRKLLSAALIPTGATVVFGFNTVLEANETIRATAEQASEITLTISGVEFDAS